jgi:hypothetical protein
MTERESEVSAPDREDVEQQWVRLIRGEITREEAHAWAKVWVEDRNEQVVDWLVESALQRLHGFDMVYTDPEHKKVRHGGPGNYVHDATWISESFERWKTQAA